MSQAGSQAWAFYRDVAKNERLWTIRDSGGFPAPKNMDGRRAQPFWSSLSRVQKILANVSAYDGFEPVELSWRDFCDKWVPGLTKDGILVGVNWSGPQATGYDIEPEVVQQSVQAVKEENEPKNT